MRRLVIALALGALVLAAACGGGDDSSSASPTGTIGGLPTLEGLQGQLASIVLQQTDVPDGLEGDAPKFSTNADVAGADQAALAKLTEQGRQLGVDVQFIPTQRLDDASPLKGGVQSSASVYTNTQGATESYSDTEAQARANNWEANYPDIVDLHVTEVPQHIGDESIWLRISGLDCDPGSAAHPCSGEQHRVNVDNVVFRVGRVRAYLQVTTLFPPDNRTPDVFEDQITIWAQAVAQRARETFPTA